MRKSYLLFALTVLVLSKLDAATFQLVSNLDNSFRTPASGTPGQPDYVAPVYSTTVESPFVGSLTLSYDASSALANGSYALNSLSNFQLSVLFPGVNSGADVTFNQTHLDFAIAGIYIQVIDGNFFFTHSAGGGISLTGDMTGGSANFINSNYLFTTQPLDSATRMGFGGYVVEYNALYQLVDISTRSGTPGEPTYTPGTTIYQGNYGNPVPEPSALSLLTVGMAGMAVLRRVRRKAD